MLLWRVGSADSPSTTVVTSNSWTCTIASRLSSPIDGKSCRVKEFDSAARLEHKLKLERCASTQFRTNTQGLQYLVTNHVHYIHAALPGGHSVAQRGKMVECALLHTQCFSNASMIKSCSSSSGWSAMTLVCRPLLETASKWVCAVLDSSTSPGR